MKGRVRPNDLGRSLVRFFQEYLPTLRGMSPHTIHNYRDALLLLLRFLSTRQRCGIERLDISAITADSVGHFLKALERERHNATSRCVRVPATKRSMAARRVSSVVDANARPSDASKDRRVYKSVRHAALDGATEIDERVTPGLFGYKHLGINVIATSVDEIDPRTAVLHFKDGEGVMNGGHGMAILRGLQADPGVKEMPPNFIKISVVTGLDDAVIPEVAGANNTSVQVKVASLLELENAFEPLKKALKGTRMESSVQYREGDKAPVKVEDLIAVMTCFRSDVYSPTDHRRTPHNAYAYKTGVVGDFRADLAGYHALAPKLPEILEFQDYVRTQPKKEYNESGGRFGLLKFVDSIFTTPKGDKRKAPLPEFEMQFTGERVAHRVNIAAVYPILAAFRALIKRTGAGTPNDRFEWSMPFEEIKVLWEEISVEVMDTTKETCFSLNYNLNALGKSRPHWQNIQRIVENALLKRQLKASQAETEAALA